MEKQTDSSTSSSTSISGGSTTTVGNNTAAVSGEANQSEQILQKQHRIHSHQNNLTSISTKNSAENQPNNSLGCGPSSTTTTTATSSSMVIGSSSSNVGGNNIKSSNRIISSLNNTTLSLSHQPSNNTNSSTTTAHTASVLSNTASSVSVTTASNPTNSASSLLSAQMAPINLNISTTTGGNFSVSVDPQITVENLKKIIAKKLKVAKDRICLLHREKELQDGLLKDNNLMDGSKIILIPNVETGLLAQRPENTVMQALESLNDSQVNDFLSGKTPLNLSMRLGDHMMLIQLQLSTVNPANGVAHSGANCSSSSSRQRSSHHHHHHHRSSRTSVTTSTATQTAGAAAAPNYSHHHHHHHHHHHSSNTATASGSEPTNPTAVSVSTTAQNVTAVRKLELDTTCQAPRNNSNNTTTTLLAPHASRAATSIINRVSSSAATAAAPTKTSDLSSFLSKRDYESLQNIVKSIAMAQPSRLVQQPITTSNTTSSAVQTTSIVLSNPAATGVPVVAAPSFHASSEAVLLEQSPIKSLSNLVSSPIKTTAIKNIPKMSTNTNSSSTSNNVALGPHTVPISAVTATSSNTSVAAANSAMCQDPIAAKLTSCLCTRLNSSTLGPVVNSAPHNSAKQCIETACVSQQQLQTVPHPHQQQHQHHHRQQQLLQPHTTRTTTSTVLTSTPNYKTPSSIITALNGSASCSPPSSSRSSSSLHKTAHNPISRKHRHHHHHHHHHHHYHHTAGIQQQLSAPNSPKVVGNTSTSNKVATNDSGFTSGDDSTLNASLTKPVSSTSSSSTSSSSTSSSSTSSSSSSSSSPSSSSNNSITQTPVSTTPVVAAAAAPLTTSNTNVKTSASNVTLSASSANAATPIELDDSGIVSDSRTLAEASRNLTQTLRKLSKEVFTNKIDFSASEETPRKSGSGAVIESMKNHGKGIYSGTFSGTLNPALQDRYGRPKRDISTVIHILNDLLSATPQYHRGARISFEAPSTSSAAAASVAAASGSTGTIHHSSRSKHHLSSKHHQSSHPCVKCIKTHSSSSAGVNLQSASTTSNAGGASSHNNSTTSSPVCTYGECNGHYVSSKTHSTKTYACCQQELAGNASSLATAASAVAQQHQAGHNSGSAHANTNHTSNGQQHHHHHHGSSHHHHHHHHHQTTVDERKVCQCRYRVQAETGERERDYTCQKCAAELDNIKTKSKLDQLRLVMQQRKQKREARKLKGAPYGARVVGTTAPATGPGVTDNAAATLTASNSTISSPISVATAATAPSEVSPNHLVEEVDTAA